MHLNAHDKVLIIAAHPDDEILGCGGFLSKYARQIEISIVLIAEGDSCRFDSAELTPIVVKEINHR
jgi:LmbE family N-acetylglucosaminyl deacetylase